jgi:hypothetical protein
MPSEIQSKGIYIIAFILIGVLGFYAVWRVIDVNSAAEVRAIRKATEISVFVNSLSNVDNAVAVVNSKEPYYFEVKYMEKSSNSDRLKTWLAKTTFSVAVSDEFAKSLAESLFKYLKESGYYIVVVPYDEKSNSIPLTTGAMARIGAYPSGKDKTITEFQMVQEKRVCVEKTPGKPARILNENECSGVVIAGGAS